MTKWSTNKEKHINIILKHNLKIFKVKKRDQKIGTSQILHSIRWKNIYSNIRQNPLYSYLLTIKPCFLSVNLLQYHLLASDLTGNHHIFSKIWLFLSFTMTSLNLTSIFWKDSLKLSKYKWLFLSYKSTYFSIVM